MKRNGILNLGLSQAIAAIWCHGDHLIVCDAGFPIPSSVPRIDLALLPDIPDLETVLRAIHGDFVAEKVAYATEMAQNNPNLVLPRSIPSLRVLSFTPDTRRHPDEAGERREIYCPNGRV